MPRRVLWVLLVAGVVCAGVGTGLLLSPPSLGAASFGWTAYSPLSSTAYVPFSIVWGPKIGVALLALGAGSTGGVITALSLRRPPRR